MDNLLKFDISDIRLSKVLDEYTALLDVKVCTSGNNAHDMPFTGETLKRAAESSLRGKPLVGEYSNWRGDIGTHTKPQDSNRIGYFVENQDFRYTDNIDGTTSLYAYAILWKEYAPSEYQAIVDGKDHAKGVSMEIRWKDKKQGFEGNQDLEEITDFAFRGVAILGDRYTPASQGSNAQMIVFSEKVKETEMKYFSDGSIRINNTKEAAIDSSSWSNPGRKLYKPILDASNIESLVNEAYLIVEAGYKDNPSSNLKYPHHTIKSGELVVNVAGLEAAFSRASSQGIVEGKVRSHLLRHYRELGLSTENFAVKEDETLAENENKVMMAEEEEKKKKEAEMAAESKPAVEDNKDEKKDEKKEGDEKKAEMAAESKPADKEHDDDEHDDDEDKEDKDGKEDYALKFAEAESKIKNMEAELSELRDYKSGREKADKDFAVSEVLSKVANIMPKEEIENFQKEAENLAFAEVEGFKNKVKARALDFAVESKTNEGTKKMPTNTQQENKPKKFW